MDLQGEDLSHVIFKKSHFGNARFQGAIFKIAQLQGAYFEGTRLQGVYFEDSHFDASTYFPNALLHGAAARKVNFRNTPRILDHVGQMFGDATVLLPRAIDEHHIFELGAWGSEFITIDHPDWPDHWPKTELVREEFDTKWRAWQATLPPGWDTPTYP